MATVLPDRLDWPSAVGNFLLNYGMLDWHVSVFLENHLPDGQYAKIKTRHLKDRVLQVKQLVDERGFSLEQKSAFAKFFDRFETVRELRNHIAHGILRVGPSPDGKSMRLTLTLAGELDADSTNKVRHVEFAELVNALSELRDLIESFSNLSGFTEKK